MQSRGGYQVEAVCGCCPAPHYRSNNTQSLSRPRCGHGRTSCATMGQYLVHSGINPPLCTEDIGVAPTGDTHG
jgi:hypothetical protein